MFVVVEVSDDDISVVVIVVIVAAFVVINVVVVAFSFVVTGGDLVVTLNGLKMISFNCQLIERSQALCFPNFINIIT